MESLAVLHHIHWLQARACGHRVFVVRTFIGPSAGFVTRGHALGHCRRGVGWTFRSQAVRCNANDEDVVPRLAAFDGQKRGANPSLRIAVISDDAVLIHHGAVRDFLNYGAT